MNATTNPAYRPQPPALSGALDAATFAQLMADVGLMQSGANAETGTHIAVAVSGGADSMCLTLLAHQWAAALNGRVTALTVDHGLRAGSADEAQQVKRWLDASDIAHHTLEWKQASEKTGSVQARAREARYQLMTDWCRENRVTTLLVAHHLEDQGETFLMRMAKGSSLMGLAAMAPRRQMDGVDIVRPLLAVPRARLGATLQAMGQSWIEDPSNTNPAFERVRVRRLMAALEMHENIAPARFAAAASGAGRLRRQVETLGDVFLARHGCQHGGGWMVSLAAFLDLPGPLQHHLLGRLIVDTGGGQYAPRQAKVERLRDWIQGQTRGSARTLGGVRIGRKTGETGTKLLFQPEGERRKKAVSLVETGKLPYINEGSSVAPCTPLPQPHL